MKQHQFTLSYLKLRSVFYGQRHCERGTSEAIFLAERLLRTSQ
jgi:hypothetical protein